MNKLLFLIALTFPFVSHAISYCKLYYPSIKLDECNEMISILKNYAKFSDELKMVAKDRLIEIKFELLSMNDRVKIIQDKIIKFNDIPIDVQTVVQQYSKPYSDLSESVQESVILYYLGANPNLSQDGKSYINVREQNSFLDKLNRENTNSKK